MKKVFFLAAFAVISAVSFGQVSFGAQAGANLAFGKEEFDNTGLPFTTKPLIGFFAGFLAEIPFGEKIAFRPELNFIQKGDKSTIFSSYENKRTLNYIEVPLNVVYKLKLGSGNFFFGLGPSLGYGISGKNKSNSTTDVKFDGKKQEDINNGLGDDKEHLKAFDFGADVLVGYKLGMGVFFRLGYTYDFININPEKDKSYKNRGFNVGVGYMFGGSHETKSKTKTTN
jgi:Outer membrane protein beta-barrel domain